MNRKEGAAGRLRTGLLAAAALAVVSLIVAYPGQAFDSSLAGLTVWWEYVFPALLPFFILSELLIGFGVVHAAGALMEPAMRSWLRLPGAGGWALALSFAAGVPGGAKAAADLRRAGAISREEGNRLLAASHVASPIFLLTVIAAGFAGRPDIGLPLIAIHLVSVFAAGWVLARLPRRRRAGEGEATQPQRPTIGNGGRIDASPPTRGAAKLAYVMAEAQRKDGRPLGRLLGDAVSSAVQSLLVVGGWMIVFSVALRLLAVVGIAGALRALLEAALVPLGMAPALAEGAVTAVFELHLGAFALVQDGGSLTAWGAALLSAAIAWGGLSVHAQVGGLIGGTDLQYRAFLLGRAAQAAAAALAAFLLWGPLRRTFGGAAPALSPIGTVPGVDPMPVATPLGAAAPYVWSSLQALAAFVLAVCLASACMRLWRALASGSRQAASARRR